MRMPIKNKILVTMSSCGCQCICPTNSNYSSQMGSNRGNMSSAGLATKPGANQEILKKQIDNEFKVVE